MKEYEIWIEGYATNGNSSGASFIGGLLAKHLRMLVVTSNTPRPKLLIMAERHITVDTPPHTRRETNWICREPMPNLEFGDVDFTTMRLTLGRDLDKFWRETVKYNSVKTIIL